MTAYHIVLIHGICTSGKLWGEMAAALQQRGFTVHTPTLRYHDLPFLEGAQKMAELSISDYASDLVEFVKSLDSPPILMGWSMGGLLAQIVAGQVEHQGMVLLVPAPTAGMFNLYPSMVGMFIYHFMQPAFWRKPYYPTWDTFRRNVAPQQSESFARELFNQLCAESGRAIIEMAYWPFDPYKATSVNPALVSQPVLVIGAGHDRIVAPRVGRATARCFKRGHYELLPEADHILILGPALPTVLNHIDQWLDVERLRP